MSKLAEKAYLLFKKDLIEDKFPIDEIITEQMLVERYGVSRTPIREAITRLIYEGFLKKYTKKGYTIKCNSEREIQDIEESRFILESGIIDIIIANASDTEIKGLLDYIKYKDKYTESIIKFGQEFHLNMARLTKNDILYDMLETLLYKNARPSTSIYRQRLENYKNIAMKDGYFDIEHKELVQALLERDAQKAKDILRRDIENLAPLDRK